ncbi:helix-turn-helix domain-containing protein [Halomonas dongshanensis]|uniref:Helix-turn-helix domain-containing protein n=1 Tax=Halomonas dongshanensis TaxID=2890835 RepID=A0ABT2E906_9GAMM|nr:helix-turn-helix domain-containing protein [Halomonas dongshanensis]MCS2607833.1 helix-turn-helix domain-containing protein [Halomonas dongshanensis]
MTIALHHCLDAVDHAKRLEGWQQESSQIEPGIFSGEIVDISSNKVRLFRESANLGLSQHMHFPDSHWHLVTPLCWSSGELFDKDTVTVLPRCDQFWSVTPSHYDLLVVSVARGQHEWVGHNERRLRRLDVPFECLKHVREQWRAMTDYLRQRPQDAPVPEVLQQALIVQLEESISLLLDDGELGREPNIANYRTRRYIVERCHDLMRQHPEEPPSLLTLCSQLKISRRTLQYSFQTEVGHSPVTYLRAMRLNAVRRSLLQDPTQRLADAAAAQGFFHQSYFCREYRRLFQELPSTTCARAIDTGRQSAA